MAENPIYVTVAGAGDKSGSTWANAMGRAEWETDLEAPPSADDSYFVEEGTYTLTEDIDSSATNGTSTAPIKIIGVKSGTSNEPPVFADHAFTTARPLIAAAGNMWWFGDYWIFKNLRLTTTETWGFRYDLNSTAYNCKVTATGGSWAFTLLGLGSRILGCEADCNTGGVRLTSKCVAYGCYIHDGSGDGFEFQGGGEVIASCVIDTMGIGIDVNSRNDPVIFHNTIYGCTTAISGTTAHNVLSLNNIIDGNTNGASWGTEYTDNYWDYNCWDNTSDTSNVTKGDNAVTGDPSMTNPAAGDFSIPSGSNCVDAALDAGDLTGATV